MVHRRHLEHFERDSSIFPADGWSVVADEGPARCEEGRARRRVGPRDRAPHVARPLRRAGSPAIDPATLGRTQPAASSEFVAVTRLADFLLTARELMRSSIDAELITLRARARSTGLQGERNAGDEFDGLTRALLSAGSRAVLVSLWNVDQRSSFELMRHYGRGSLREASRGPRGRGPDPRQRGLRPRDRAAPHPVGASGSGTLEAGNSHPPQPLPGALGATPT